MKSAALDRSQGGTDEYHAIRRSDSCSAFVRTDAFTDRARAQDKIIVGCTATTDCANAAVAADKGIFKEKGLGGAARDAVLRHGLRVRCCSGAKAELADQIAGSGAGGAEVSCSRL